MNTSSNIKYMHTCGHETVVSIVVLVTVGVDGEAWDPRGDTQLPYGGCSRALRTQLSGGVHRQVQLPQALRV